MTTFVDLFAGVGGFHLAMHRLGASCVLACEIDKHARATYEANFKNVSPELFADDNRFFPPDITAVDAEDVPDFDILCAGFPCQPFSQAGYKKGFAEERDNRGNMFYQIMRILEAKRPQAYFLENVRHLLNHDGGRTFKIIQESVKSLGYSFHYKIVKASDHGLPQHRPRLFMVGFLGEVNNESGFAFPEPQKEFPLTMSDVFEGNCDRDVGFTLRVGGRGSGIDDRRNWDAYRVSGEVRRLTPREGKRMMGFPDDFVMPVSEVQAMKQLGNSVAVNAVEAVALKLIDVLDRARIIPQSIVENHCNYRIFS